MATAQPERSTAEAKAMGITGIVGSYTTTYGGTPGRLHNVGLVAELIDGALVAPGAQFSFNATTGERNEAKGFEEAPVIINGELQNGIGGGVCQVSTTVFNAAFEAGLSIDRRTNHALYINHYPLGRDATVNYPDLDLVFTNDTDRWLLLRTFVGAGSLTVNLYGAPQGRRVETETAPLQVDGKVPVEADRRPDAASRARRSSSSSALRRARPRHAPRLRGGRHADVRHDVAVVLRRRAHGRPARDEAAAEAGAGRPKTEPRRCRDHASGGDGAGAAPPVDDSALSTSATNHSGTRIGRRVDRVDGRVRRPAARDGSPSRETTYS